jgi:hypothetical protein
MEFNLDIHLFKKVQYLYLLVELEIAHFEKSYPAPTAKQVSAVE